MGKKVRGPHSPRNSLLANGIGRLSRSAVYKKRALYKRKKVGGAKKPEAAPSTVVKKIGGDKNGGSRTVVINRQPRFYPTEDRMSKKIRKRKTETPKLRSSITPGTILILLAGRHQGKRVVFLKQLSSGLLLVSGPYQVNGVPLRRVPQSYVIATQTKVDISKVTVPEALTDDYFKREKKAKRRADDMFEQSEQAYAVSDKRKGDQKSVDEPLMAEISKVPHLKKYMRSLFSLRKHQYPHQMVF